MKILDFHTHTFPDELAPRAISTLCEHSPDSHNYTDGTLSDLRRSMKQNGISCSVNLPIATRPSQVHSINVCCEQMISDDIIPFGTLHPQYDTIESEIAYLLKIGVKGVKFHPEYQDFYIDDLQYFPIYEQLEKSGLVVLFHAGKDPGPFTCDHALPFALKYIAKTFPSMKMVAAHMGGWKVWDEVEEVLCGSPIFFDISAVSEYLPKDQFMKLTNKHGVERVLFATDSPWFDQRKTRDWLDSMPLTDGEKELIFWNNGAGLLGIG